MSIPEWAQVGTAIGTFLLAVATFVLVRTTRQVLQHSVVATSESVRARQDALAPGVSVLTSTRDARPFEMSNFVGHDPVLLSSQEFIIPASDHQRVGLGAELLIVNDDDRTAVVRFVGLPTSMHSQTVGCFGDFLKSHPDRPAQMTRAPVEMADGDWAIPARSAVYVELIGDRTIREWLAAEDDPLLVEVHAGSHLSGAPIDQWVFAIEGAPVKVHPANAGRVAHPINGAHPVTTRPTRRTYPT